MDRLRSVCNWLGDMLIALLGFISAPLVMPFVYWFPALENLKFFWYYADDEDGFFGTDTFRKQKGYTLDTSWNRFRCAYHWSAIRNPAWNLQASLKPVKGIKLIRYEDSNLRKNFFTVSPLEFAVFKYVDKDGKYMDNTGEFISVRYSTLGRSLVWYSVRGYLYFRYSFTKDYKLFRLEAQMGTSDTRHLFKFKILKKKKYYLFGG